MALSIDTSPVRQFMEHVAAGATPAVWLWQVAVAVAAVLLGWFAAHVAFSRIRPSERWKFGEGDFERVAYPLFAYLFTVIGRAVLARYQTVAMLDILASVLVAWIAIRIAVYILGHVLPAGAFLRAVVRAVAWLAWIAVVLHVTGLLPEVIATLDGIGFTTGGKQRISVWLIAQGIAALALTLTVALWLARITEGRVMSTQSVDLSTRVVIAKLIRVAAVFLAVLIALPLVGIDVTTLSIFSGALGVGLGFGLQKIAANYVSGFIVLLDHSLRIGDTVTVDGRRGEVKEIASRYTVIKGGDGVESIIPNEKLITETVSHHTYSDPKVSQVLAVLVSYESDVERACALLLEVAGRHPRVVADPPASARVRSLRDHGVELELTVWSPDPTGEGELRSALYMHVLRAFRDGGIAIPYPRREVRLHTTTETEEAVSKTST
jgi:small-conductance mechanosensitive channel